MQNTLSKEARERNATCPIISKELPYAPNEKWVW
jgi:hypothetical protein